MSKPEMIKYTAKNFAKADLATHPDGRIAARVNPESKYPWVLSTRDDDYDWEGDDYLARDGWTPVDLAGLTARAEKAEEVSESWRALCQAATDQRDARDLAAHMWKKVAREHIVRANTALPYASAVQQQRDQATQSAEQAERSRDLAIARAERAECHDCGAGATVIEQPRTLTPDAITDEMVERALRSWRSRSGAARVPDTVRDMLTAALTEPPSRPEWADLADVIRGTTYHPEPDDLARALHHEGVRVVTEEGR